ncbi:MAG: DNA-binding response regulator [SAR86 cluster bacterium]|uniref:DNA-binding response regulator n=1 Tax=SAR86 cluster bacterium TaxID=2030880 RepID=A0A2A4MKE1_9GAMM|nr:MAG: DNA-binding response regulator [SAR86 cluster bacterium]
MITTLIVDDEPLAREGLTLLLAGEEDIQIIGECSNGTEAIAAIAKQQPDLVFLDIKMPQQDGFDVLSGIGSPAPLIVFITAYDEFAVEAFDANAIDYLLKPVRRRRLQETLERIRKQLKQRDAVTQDGHLDQLLHSIAQLDLVKVSDKATQASPDARIIVRSHGQIYFLQAQDIIWVEAAGDYVTIHTSDKSHLLRDTMRNMEKRLDPHGFKRVHRSAIVKLSCVQQLKSNPNNDYHVVLKNGTTLNLGRSYKDSLYQSLLKAE